MPRRSLVRGRDGMAQASMPASGGDIQAQWGRVRGRLRDEFGEAAFRSWLKSMTLAEVADGRVRIGVPTRFLRDWGAAHHVERIRALWTGENNAIGAIDIFVSGGGAPLAEPPTIAGGKESKEKDPASAAAPTDEKEKGAALEPRSTFEN